MGTAALLAVLVLSLLAGSLLLGVAAAPSAAGATSAGHVSAAVAAPSDTEIYLNRSQDDAPGTATYATYPNEFVTLNNTTTLTKIAGTSGLTTLTVAASTCKWVTIANDSIAINATASILAVNVTAANASGTVDLKGSDASPLSGGDSFKACGGSAYWINYVVQAYHIYDVAAPTLGVAAKAVLVWTEYSDSTESHLNQSISIAAAGTLTLKVPAKEALELELPSLVNGTKACTSDGQVCSYPQYAFESATLSTNVTTSYLLHFSAANSTGYAYSNWSALYSKTTVSADTPIGLFGSDFYTVFTAIFVVYWYLWVVVLLLLVVVAAVVHTGHRRGGHRD